MKLRLRIQIIDSDGKALAQVDVDNIPDDMGRSANGLAISPTSDRWTRVFYDHALRAARTAYEAATRRTL